MGCGDCVGGDFGKDFYPMQNKKPASLDLEHFPNPVSEQKVNPIKTEED